MPIHDPVIPGSQVLGGLGRAAPISTIIANSAGGILNQAELRGLFGKIRAHPELGAAPPTLIKRALQLAIKDHRYAITMMDGEKVPLEMSAIEKAYRAVLKDETTKGILANKPSAKGVALLKGSPGYAEAPKRGFMADWNKMSVGQQVTAGICFLSSASFLTSGVSRFQSAFQVDETGRRHFNPSTVTIAMCEILAGAAAGAFGLSYMRKSGRG